MSLETRLSFEKIQLSQKDIVKNFYLEFLAGRKVSVIRSKMAGIAFFILFANFHRQNDQL